MDKVTVVRLAVEGEKFEILVKPDPALEYKLGKRKEISGVLVSDEVYSDSGKGTRASTEKLMKAFKTTDPTTIAALILQKGDLNLTTDQRRKMVEGRIHRERATARRCGDQSAWTFLSRFGCQRDCRFRALSRQ